MIFHDAGVSRSGNLESELHFTWAGNSAFAEVPEFGNRSHGNIEQSCGFLAVVPGKLQNLCGFGVDGHGLPLRVIQAPDIASFSGVTPELFVVEAETHRVIENLF